MQQVLLGFPKSAIDVTFLIVAGGGGGGKDRAGGGGAGGMRTGTTGLGAEPLLLWP